MPKTKSEGAATTAAKKTTKTTATKTSAKKATAAAPKAKKATAAKSTAVKSAKTVAAKSEVKLEKPVKTKRTKVLFVTSEAAPFAFTGGMGEVCGALPRALNELGGVEARVIMPLYDEAAHYKPDMTFVCSITVSLSWRNQYCGLFKLKQGNTTYYFVDNEYYFKRPNLYGYYDDAERFAFFSRAVLELIPYLDFTPDVIQSNDHLTALVPIYYMLEYKSRPGYGRIKNVFTIHNINYQGTYPLVIAGDVFGISDENVPLIEFGGSINLVKGAILSCDKITAMSPQYAKEIRLPEYSCGLDGVLTEHRAKIVGILNGIDTDEFDPKTSPSLFENYCVDCLDKKSVNKVAFQRMFNLPEDKEVPLVCMIAHMTSGKGYDILRKSLNKATAHGVQNILDENIQLVIMGTGDADVEGYFMHVQSMCPGRVVTLITYNRDLAHKVLAAADMCLVPSRTEPCGLTQMAACRFGAVPIVRATGGLSDSIKDLVNGIVFEQYDSDVLDAAIVRAVALYRDKPEWKKLQTRAMKSDFAWSNCARSYEELYAKL